MIRFFKPCCLLAVCAAVAAVSVLGAEMRPMSLQDCVQAALSNNFDIQIERRGPDIARFDLENARSYYVPVIEASFIGSGSTSEPSPRSEDDSQALSGSLKGVTHWGMSYDVYSDLAHHGGRRTGDTYDYNDGELGVSVRQPLWRNAPMDAGRLNILVGRKAVDISRSALTARIMGVVSQVEQAYYDLIYARETVAVQEKALQLAEQLLADNRKRVEIGTIAPLDEKQSESQVGVSRADLIGARQQLHARQNALKALLTDNYAGWHGTEISPTEQLAAVPERIDLHESWGRGLAGRPELRQLRLDLERRDITLHYRRNQISPSLDLVASAGGSGRHHSPFGVLEDEATARNPAYSAGVVFSVPLDNRGPRNAYASVKAAREQAQLMLKQMEQDVLVQIDDAAKVVSSSFERIEATRASRQYAEAALDAEMKKLEAGKSTSFVVLQLQKDLTAVRSAEIGALADYNKALSRFALAEASILERNRLSIQEK